KENGLHTALDTSGYICSDRALEVLNFVDLVLLDIKTIDSSLHHQLTGVEQKNTLTFLEELESRQIPTWIRHVLVPELTDRDDALERLAQYLSSYKTIQKIELLPYHTMGVHKYEALGLDYPLKGIAPLSKERLENAKAIFRKWGFVF
ncbi:MAG: pyruvate formate lyase 1-activating protein, partial [Parabacteroides sp.]|nr:pyruvate formate lyase 1-activating protein [Parabacteroides sp.]